MNNLYKFVGISRKIVKTVGDHLLTSSVNRSLKSPIQKYFVLNSNNLSAREMSQKSITSFFKATPKNQVEVKQEPKNDKPPSNKETSPNTKDVKDENSPVTNGKEKRLSKRPRLESTDSETSSPKKSKELASPPSDKKKKIKRLRIESTGSEEETTETTPDKSPEQKLVKSKSPKTYSSPKTRTAKTKVVKTPLTNINNDKSKEKSLSPEKEVKSPESNENSPASNKLSPKKEVKSPESNENSPASNKLSPKKEVKSPASNKKSPNKAESRKMNSFFIKKESTADKEEGKKNGDAAKVAEEDYNPAKAKYDPIADACWTAGQEVPYLALAKTLETIEGTSARLKMIDILSHYFRSVIALTPEDLLPSVYLCLNQLAPAYKGLELGIAETYLMKAIGQCTGCTLSQMRSLSRRHGDLGAVAQLARARQRTMFAQRPLTVRNVMHALKDIAGMTGQASVNKKIAKIQSLYTACRSCEAKYLIRSLEGKLRIGLAEQSVLQALAVAVTATPPPASGTPDIVLDASKGISQEQFKARVDENALIIKTTYCECPNYELVIPAVLAYGVAALPSHCRLTPGLPLKPMLAHPAKGLQELFNRFEGSPFTCEWKYDGERAQIHVPAGEDGRPDYSKAAVFSRNQEDNTSKYPDVIRRLPSLLKDSVSSCVLDSEAVAYDTVNDKILPFQILSTRKRKDASESDIKVQVCVFAFDLLYLNGEPLVRRPLRDRRQLLWEHFNQVKGEWQFATYRDCTESEEVQQFLEESVKGSCEGLMVKTLEGPRAHYDIARRSHNWLKVKKDYLEGIGDTVDLVVVGGWWGRGRRAGQLGGFLLAVRDSHTDHLQTICKIGTGFSDEDLQNLTASLKELIIDAPRSYYRYDSSHTPDVWFSAQYVWEVRCADLSVSPAHRAAIGLVDNEKGISLRFPRFVRVREDKTPEQATTARQVADMYLAQDQVRNQAPRQVNEDEFY